MSVVTNRIDQELPDLCVLVRSNTIADDFVVTGKNKKSSTTSADINPTPMIKLLALFSLSYPIRNSSSQNKNEMTQAYLKAFGWFRKN